MSDCIFCRIVAGEIPARKKIETPFCLAFEDITPQAPFHFLVIPRKHVPDIATLADDPEKTRILDDLFSLVARLAKGEGGGPGLKKGFRVVTNTGPDGGQTVGHLHFHVLGGRPFAWPPG